MRVRAAEAAFQRPLAGGIVILSRFGRRHRRFHQGIDIRGKRRIGDPVFASQSGWVSLIKTGGGYGRMILIKHGNGYFTRYAHLHALRVKQGQEVRAGQAIGTVGRSGHATGPHLHFEILTPERKPIDPAPYIGL